MKIRTAACLPLLALAWGCEAPNTPPRILEISPESESVRIPDSIILHAEAEDDDGDLLQYEWTSTSCSVIGQGADVRFETIGGSSCHAGEAQVELTVTDGRGGQDTARVSIEVSL
ncbi:hypothetical protein L6R50_08260 [Myxococcota bacterium]|nr:hypothetical protein [Myxococcota bacterium]